jgi:hypothetical protein
MAIKKALTDREVKAVIASGDTGWLNQNLGNGQGSLCLRYWPTGSTWYYSYNVRGKTRRIIIAPESGTDQRLTLAEARDRALTFAAQRRDAPDGDLLLHQKMQTDAAKRSKAAHEAEERARSLRTVEKLIGNYIDDLKARGKTSAKQVEGALGRLLRDYPALAERDAASVTALEWVAVLRRYGKTDGHADKMRKVRSYLRAAYAAAIRADLDPMQEASAGMMLAVNPIDGIPAGTSRARERNLSEPEFRALWKRLLARDHPLSKTLQALILLGGQRYTQLIRATARDYQDGEIILYDPKGKRTIPRKHVLPVCGAAKVLLDDLVDRSALLGSEWLFTITGAIPARLDNATHFVGKLSSEMVNTGEAVEPFCLSDIRRSVETILAGKLRISKDDRAQLMSHGISGVQEKHYDRSGHMDAKIEALAKWERWLAQESGVVVPLRAGGSA